MQMRKKILVIEDEHEIRTILAIAIEQDPELEAVVARDGAEGIKAALEIKPDAILLDVLMPGLDGYAVCRRIKEHPEIKHIPIIFITAKSDCAEMARATEAGGCACLAKPFDPLQLPAKIKSIISGAEKQCEE